MTEDRSIVIAASLLVDGDECHNDNEDPRRSFAPGTVLYASGKYVSFSAGDKDAIACVVSPPTAMVVGEASPQLFSPNSKPRTPRSRKSPGGPTRAKSPSAVTPSSRSVSRGRQRSETEPTTPGRSARARTPGGGVQSPGDRASPPRSLHSLKPDLVPVTLAGIVKAQVHGPVEAGQVVVNSGKDDGFAVALDPMASFRWNNVIGESLESVPAGESKRVDVSVGYCTDHTEAVTEIIRSVSDCRRATSVMRELKGSIQVFCRVRPLNNKEKTRFNGETSVKVQSDYEIQVTQQTKTMSSKLRSEKKLYEFDRVFGPESGQAEVFSSVRSAVTSVLTRGGNICVFAYGQTGSGKTYTMDGPPRSATPAEDGSLSQNSLESCGISRNALRELAQLQAVRQREGWSFDIKVSSLQIYNEHVQDLLCEMDGVPQYLDSHLSAAGRNEVQNLTSVNVENFMDVNDVINTAICHRAVGRHKMNASSSRSHMLVSVTVSGHVPGTKTAIHGKLNFVDLAGSERVTKSGAQGKQLQEAQNINKSLSALGDVTQALTSGAPHIPYRNSKLTYLLQDSLGGADSRTIMIVTVSPSLFCVHETLSSLNFSARIKNVELGSRFRGQNAQQHLERCEKQLGILDTKVQETKRDNLKEDVKIALEDYHEQKKLFAAQLDEVMDMMNTIQDGFNNTVGRVEEDAEECGQPPLLTRISSDTGSNKDEDTKEVQSLMTELTSAITAISTQAEALRVLKISHHSLSPPDHDRPMSPGDRRIGVLERENQDLKYQLSISGESTRAFRQELEVAYQQLEDSQSANIKAETRLAELEQELKQSKVESAELPWLSKQHAEEVKALQIELSDVYEQLEEYQTMLLDQATTEQQKNDIKNRRRSRADSSVGPIAELHQEISSLRENIKTFHEEKSALTKERDTAMRECDNLSTVNKNLRSDMENMKSEFRDFSGDLVAVESTIESSEAEKGELRNEIQHLRTSVSTLKSELEWSKKTARESEESNADVMKEYNKLLADIASMKDQLEESLDELGDANNQLALAHKDSASTKTELSASLDKIIALESHNRQLELKLDELRKSIDGNPDSAEEVSRNLDAADNVRSANATMIHHIDAAEAVRTTNTIQQHRIRDLEQTVENLKNSLSAANESKASAEADVRTAQSCVDRMKDSKEAAERQFQLLQDEYQNLVQKYKSVDSASSVELQSARQARDTLESECESYKTRLSELSSQVLILQNQNNDLSGQIKELGHCKELASKCEMNEQYALDLSDQIHNLKAEVTTYAEENCRLKGSLHDVELSQGKLKIDHAASREEVSQQQQRISSLKEELRDAVASHRRAVEEVNNLTMTLNESMAQARRYDSDNMSLRAELKGLKLAVETENRQRKMETREKLKLQTELDHVQTELTLRNEKIKGLNEECRRRQDAIEEQWLQASEKSAELRRCEERLDDSTTECVRFKGECDSMRVEQEAMKRDLLKARNEVATLTEEAHRVRHLEEEVSCKSAELTRANEELVQAYERIQDLEEAHLKELSAASEQSWATEELNRVTKEVSHLKRMLKDAMDECESLKASQESLRTERDSIKSELREAQDQCRAHERVIDDLRSEIAATERSVNGLNSGQEKLTREYSELMERLGEARQLHEDDDKIISQLRVDLAESKTRNDVLTQEITSVRAEMAAAREELDDADDVVETNRRTSLTLKDRLEALRSEARTERQILENDLQQIQDELEETRRALTQATEDLDYYKSKATIEQPPVTTTTVSTGTATDPDPIERRLGIIMEECEVERAKTKDLENKLDDITEKYLEADKAQRALYLESHERNLQLSEKTLQVKEVQEENKNLREIANGLRDSLAGAVQRGNQMEEKLSRQKELFSDSQSRLDNSGQDLQDLSNKLIESQRELRYTREQLSAAKCEISSLEATAADLRVQVASGDCASETLNLRLEELDKSSAELREENKKLRADAERSINRLDSVRSEHCVLQKAHREQQAANRLLKDCLDENNREISDLKGKLSMLKKSKGNGNVLREAREFSPGMSPELQTHKQKMMSLRERMVFSPGKILGSVDSADMDIDIDGDGSQPVPSNELYAASLEESSKKDEMIRRLKERCEAQDGAIRMLEFAKRIGPKLTIGADSNDRP